MDARQPILLLIAVIVPLFLLLTGRRRALLGWVGVTLSVHIFDTTILTNLPAGRVVGLIYLPYALLSMPKWLRRAPAQAWMLNFVYLTVLGVLFGFLFPWPDTTGNRPLSMTAPGRTIVYLVRLVSDVSLTIFVASELQKPGRIFLLARSIVLGATLTALAGLLSFFTQFDPYFTITGLHDLAGNQRPRGLSFEPRGLGMATVYGLIVLIMMPGRLSFKRFSLTAINLLGLLASYSTSSLALLIAGLITAWTLLATRTRLLIISVLALMLAFVALAPLFVPMQFSVAMQSIQERIDPTNKLRGAVAENIGQEIAYRLDSFDASALLFLLDQPQYMLIGTGPGMMLLPASDYVPPGVYQLLYPKDRGLDGLPTQGLLLEISNSGILGLCLWLVQVAASYIALRRLSGNLVSRELAREWKFGRTLFLVATVFYVVQVSITSPVWAVMLGLGWAAADLGATYPGAEPVLGLNSNLPRRAIARTRL